VGSRKEGGRRKEGVEGGRRGREMEYKREEGEI
jgi:hypothetical protein